MTCSVVHQTSSTRVCRGDSPHITLKS